MSTKLEEAREAVIEAAKEWRASPGGTISVRCAEKLDSAIDDLIMIEAEETGLTHAVSEEEYEPEGCAHRVSGWCKNCGSNLRSAILRRDKTIAGLRALGMKP